MKMKTAVFGAVLALLAAGCVESDGFSSSDNETQDFPFNIIISPVAYGSVASSRKNAAPNANINLTIIPNAGYGYVPGSLNVTAINDETDIVLGGEGFSHNFNMPASHVIVSAEFVPVMYDINIMPLANGTISSSHEKAAIGTVVALTVTPANGYALLENTFTVLQDNGAFVNRVGNNFSMPASNITINAQFSMLYNINVNQTGPNGEVFRSHERTVAGAPITVVLTPDAGYRIKEGSFGITGQANVATELSVTEYYIHTHTFSMPAFDITINVEFEEIPPGVIAVYFEGFHDEEMNLDQAGHTIRRGSNDVITVTVAAGFNSYYWYFNDTLRQEKGNRITIDSYRLDLGVYTITAVVVRNGIPYSKIVTFTVVK
ncbi:MAG: hypothetical protein FWC01_03905 [Treponema sp.]|nr:hypothetical protein [Treponema sp.]MCL2237307.1 hypothetical protein [Treponema sp.]